MINLFRRRLTFILMILQMTQFSCSKKSSNIQNEHERNERRLKKIEIDTNNYIEFKYQNQALTEIKELKNSKPSLSKISYNSQGKPQEITLSEGKVKFIYAEGYLIKEELYNLKFKIKSAYNQYHYDVNKLEEVISYNAVDLPYFRRMLFYNHDGNIERIEVYVPGDNNTFKLEMRSNYEYDNKVNPLAASIGPVLSLYMQTYSKHNIIKETTENNMGILSQVITTAYTYDKDGYPLTAVEKTTTTASPPTVLTKKFRYLP